MYRTRQTISLLRTTRNTRGARNLRFFSQDPTSQQNTQTPKPDEQQNEDEKPIYEMAKEKIQAFRTTYQQSKKKVFGDDFLFRFKASVVDAAEEVFGTKKDKDINQTLMSQTVKAATDDDKSNKDEADEDKTSEEYAGPTALVSVKEQANAWERIGQRLKEAPIIQGILGAAQQAAKSQAGQKIGQGAQAARDKIGDATEDAREFWETSQNPWVYRISSLYDGFFGETETAVAIREIRRADPDFVLEDWKKDLEDYVVPVVLEAYLRGDSRMLKQWMGEAAYNTVNHAIRDRKQEGLVVDPTVLDLDNVEVIAAKAEDKHAPIVVLQFMAQQINCIRNREGEIIEGKEDEVVANYYALAFQREYDEEAATLKWKIIEMAVLGTSPYV